MSLITTFYNKKRRTKNEQRCRRYFKNIEKPSERHKIIILTLRIPLNKIQTISHINFQVSRQNFSIFDSCRCRMFRDFYGNSMTFSHEFHLIRKKVKEEKTFHCWFFICC